ncbi:CLUMA_CG012213, isoform A, partial [Clunio marinus]
MKRGGFNKWNPWKAKSSGGFQQPKDKPLYYITNDNKNNSDSASVNIDKDSSHLTFSTDLESGWFAGWKLYFPEKSFKKSVDLVQRIRAMEKHFATFSHWYDTTEISQNCELFLNLQNIEEDETLFIEWSNFFDELRTKTTQTLACVSLAMHNIILNNIKETSQTNEISQHKKIFTRPVGFEPKINLNKALETYNELITVSGTVIRVEPFELATKMICFRCKMCNAELVVKQTRQSSQDVNPSSCHKGCPARGNFVKQLSSPFTSYYPKQMIKIQESLTEDSEKILRTLDVELIQTFVNTVVVGSIVTVTGVIKHGFGKSQQFLEKGEAKSFKPYLKCFSMEGKRQSKIRDEMTPKDLEFIQMMKAEPSPFRMLVHSLCPTIYGREEIKAGLVLALLSGRDLVTKRRSESHVLLVGNPGTGKSKLLQSCTEASSKGIYVNGPTSTGVGLTASVGTKGDIEAGALVLADGGACCIDEFDKMSAHSHILLESMEQQTISIQKTGIYANLPSRVVIIAAANPVSSFYDDSKTLKENVKISAPIMSRFDLILPLRNHGREIDEQFLAHVTKGHDFSNTSKNSFFSPTTSAKCKRENRNNLNWLKKESNEDVDVLPSQMLRLYIAYARDNFHPKLSNEAINEIRSFYIILKKSSVGVDVQPISNRQLEALMRLTLSRARADLVTEATRDHALDVINLFKFSMTDVFDNDDPSETIGSSLPKKRQNINVSKMKRGGFNKWNPWKARSSGGFQQPKDKPLYSITNDIKNNSDSDSVNIYDKDSSHLTFSTDLESGCFAGWKLYFPEKSFKKSVDLVQRIRAMETHFATFSHWYDTTEISQNCELFLNLQNIEEDETLFIEWSNFFDELRTKTTQTLACVSLAMHNIILNNSKETSQTSEISKHQKIFTRPVGFEPKINLSKALETYNELITVSGTVIRVEPFELATKMICFRCKMCNAELVVKQTRQSSQDVNPSSCHKGCPARGNFVEKLSSPFTLYYAKQMIKIQESLTEDSEKILRTLDVELIQTFVNTVVVGSIVTVTGVIKHGFGKSQQFLEKGEAKSFKPYLKCFSMEGKLQSKIRDEMTPKDLEFIQMMKAEPSPFRMLVHSLCPTIYGREEIKAGLVLALLSGRDLVTKRRSESHILLVGNPGTGKSKLLESCTEVSSKGIYVNGPTSTGVGLTASVGTKGETEAGALLLADGGACCIDEFDKMSAHSHILLESMEQQIISISKSGIYANLPSRVVIIAAANPVSSFYNDSKTLKENVRISAPMMSRFDLILPLRNHGREIDEQFLAHATKGHNLSNTSKNSFFSPTTSTKCKRENRNNLNWLKKESNEDVDVLPSQMLRLYIAYARDNFHPKLSNEAINEIKSFYLNLKKLIVGVDVQPISNRQLEALMRLTLSRARADLVNEATRDHALDVINLFRFSMTDVFDNDDPSETIGSSLPKKRQNMNVSSWSKPKQMKAFYEHLQTEKESQDRDIFTSSELKSMAKEIGVKDFDDIVYQLNNMAYILQKPNGWK